MLHRPVLDLIYVLATIAIFSVLTLLVKGVERTGPRPRGSAQREAMSGGERG